MWTGLYIIHFQRLRVCEYSNPEKVLSESKNDQNQNRADRFKLVNLRQTNPRQTLVKLSLSFIKHENERAVTYLEALGECVRVQRR